MMMFVVSEMTRMSRRAVVSTARYLYYWISRFSTDFLVLPSPQPANKPNAVVVVAPIVCRVMNPTVPPWTGLLSLKKQRL
jgi:hypothetical protein